MDDRARWWPLLSAFSWIATRKPPPEREVVKDSLGRRLPDPGLLAHEIDERQLEAAMGALWRAAAAGEVRLRGRGPWAYMPEHSPHARYGESAPVNEPQTVIAAELLTAPGLCFGMDAIGPSDTHGSLKTALRWSEVEVNVVDTQQYWPAADAAHEPGTLIAGGAEGGDRAGRISSHCDATHQPPEASALSRTGAPGRPTSIHLVEMEYARRSEAGLVLEIAREEAEHLLEWIKTAHAEAPRLTVKTIRNKIPEWRRRLGGSPEIIGGS